jgi:hypothetical protein
MRISRYGNALRKPAERWIGKNEAALQDANDLFFRF